MPEWHLRGSDLLSPIRSSRALPLKSLTPGRIWMFRVLVYSG